MLFMKNNNIEKDLVNQYMNILTYLNLVSLLNFGVSIS